MSEMISQHFVDTGIGTLAANGSSGDTYTFTVPNTSTDSIVSAWCVTSTGQYGPMSTPGPGLPSALWPTSFTAGPDGELTEVHFQNQASVSRSFVRVEVVYLTPRP